MHAFKKKDSVPCSCRTPIGPSQCATGGDQTTECTHDPNEWIRSRKWTRLINSYSDARWIKKEKWIINTKAPQEGDCHGNARAQRKRGAPTPLVTDRTSRCTHTSESATNMQFCHQLIQYWQQAWYEGVQVEIRNLVVAVQGKHPGRAWNSHAH